MVKGQSSVPQAGPFQVPDFNPGPLPALLLRPEETHQTDLGGETSPEKLQMLPRVRAGHGSKDK